MPTKTESKSQSKATPKPQDAGKTQKRPELPTTVQVQALVEENSLEDIEIAMRDNPGLRSPADTRRVLPPEEYPSGHQVRKDDARAREQVQKAIDSLQQVYEDIGTVDVILAGKVRTALRVLKT